MTKDLESRFNFTYRYIDKVVSINNTEFDNYLGQVYTYELEIKDTTESNTFLPGFTPVDQEELSFMSNVTREKGRDLTQSYDKSPYTHRKIQKTS